MKSPWGRIITGMVAIGFLVLAAYFWHRSCRWQAKVEAAVRAEPVRMAVDLSKPGDYRGVLQQTFTASHGQCLWLKTDPEFRSEEEATEALGGFTGHVAIVRADGTIDWEEDLTAKSFQIRQYWPVDGKTEQDATGYVPMLGTSIPPMGDYELRLRVEQGAPGLADVEQTLVGRYLLCGCEFIPAHVSRLMAIGASGIGGLLALGVIIVTWSCRRRTAR